MLARLANYGGPTETLALCSGVGLPRSHCTGTSPAIDAGDDTVTGPPDNLTTISAACRARPGHTSTSAHTKRSRAARIQDVR